MLSAITGQIATLGHVSNFFATPAQVALAERLAAMAGAPADARVFFTNSGTEANEAAFKITRMTGRTKIIATEGAFHGRSLGALAITHNPKYREPFAPLPGEVIFVPYGDADALAAAVDDDRGRGGAGADPGRERRRRPAGRTTSPGPARSATQHGALLWIDEVQTGMGRTGCWLVHVDRGRHGRRRDRGQGTGQRVPHRRLHRARPGRARCSVPAVTAARSAAIRSRRSPGLAVIAVIERDESAGPRDRSWASTSSRRDHRPATTR